MKMSIFGMLFFLIVLTVGPLIYFNGGSEYLQTFFSNRIEKPKINTDVTYAPVTTDEKIKVYKWKDSNGVWQFGSVAPPGLAGVESMTLQPNMNIMKPYNVPNKVIEETESGFVSLQDTRDNEDSNDKNGKEDKSGIGMSKEALENPYDPASIAELFKNSKNIQKMLENRHQQQSE